MKLFSMAIGSCLVLLVLAMAVDAGPMGILGGRKMSSGGCSSGSCGGGSSSMGMSVGSAWGSAAPAMQHSSGVQSIASNARTLDFFVNAERARVGLPPVTVIDSMSDELFQPLNDLAVTGGPAKQLKVQYPHVVAKGGTMLEAFQAWMGNEEMRSKILSSSYTSCAFRSVRGTDGTVYRVLAMGK
jgi:hypothetical protein